MSIKKKFEKIKECKEHKDVDFDGFGSLENKILWYHRGEEVNFIDGPPWERQPQTEGAIGGITKVEDFDFNKKQEPRGWTSVDKIKKMVAGRENLKDISVIEKLKNLSNYDLVEPRKREDLPQTSNKKWKITPFGTAVVNAYYDEIRKDNEIENWELKKIKRNKLNNPS